MLALLPAVILLACRPSPEVSMSRPISLEEVLRLPAPGEGGPTSVAFAPDGSVTFLQDDDGGLDRALWAWDPATGQRTRVANAPGGGIREGELSLEEQLRRERLRERGLGITRYAWSKEGETLLVPLKGEVWVQQGLRGQLERIVDGDAQDPQLSPDGTRVAFVRDDELYVVDVAGGAPRQLTHGARGTGRTHGLAEYIAQEEMGRHHGTWWARDGRHLAYVEVDETHIPVWRIPYEGKGAPGWEDHRYPFAGADNAKVSLWVVPVEGGQPVRMRIPVAFEYLARVTFLHDGALLAAVQDRRQTRLDLVRLDPATGEGQVVRTERSDLWINLHHLLRPLRDEPGAFVWGTEETGFQHLVHVAADGAARPLTSGEWMVDSVAGIDEDRGVVYFTGTRDGALERHLYAVPLTGGEPRRLTNEPGFHGVVLDRDHTRFLDRYSAADTPPRVVLRSLEDGAEVATLHVADDPRVADLQLEPPELVEVVQRDGVRLHGALYRPEGEGPWPLVVKVYGGPHVQRVTNQWGATTADLWSQHLRREGFAVLKLDNRGSSRRGLAFEGAIRHDMGHLELLDQIDGVRHLVELGVADPDHVGITGWSYGGYLSAMAVCRYPETFHVAVAGAPVTHWDGYDTHYTERYMGLPDDNPDGYEVSSVMHHAAGLEGGLMLVHGMLDENVHFRHTGRLVSALVAEGRDFELQIFPDERHAPRDEAGRLYMLERELGFLKGRLRGE